MDHLTDQPTDGPMNTASYRMSLFLCLYVSLSPFGSASLSVSACLCLCFCLSLSLPVPVHHSIHSSLPPTSVYTKVGMVAMGTEQVRLRNHRRGRHDDAMTTINWCMMVEYW